MNSHNPVEYASSPFMIGKVLNILDPLYYWPCLINTQHCISIFSRPLEYS